MTSWHYAVNGAQVGPVTLEDMKAAISEGKISRPTKVWNGEGDWQPAGDTQLAEHFPAPDTATPPPLHGDDVDNRFMWILVAVPIVGAFLDIAFGLIHLIPVIDANIALCILDEKKLKAAGHKSPVHWSVFIVPVYLWKRADVLKHKKHYFGAWMAAFVLSMFIGTAGAQGMIEDTACPIVTDIVQNQLYGSAECKAVTIEEEVTSGFYRATAILDNGNELRITIEEDGDMIYVQIPNQ